MAFQAVPDTAEIVIKYNLNLEPMFNVLHAKLTGGYTQPDLQILADIVDATAGSNWVTQQSQDASYQETTVRGLAVLNDQEAIANVAAGNGLVAQTAMPGNVTFSIKKGSGFTGRSARGRLYWIGMPVSFLSSNENILKALNAADVVQAVEDMRSAIEGTVWTPVIVSRFSDNVQRPLGVTFNWTVTSSVNDNVDSNRRRLIR